MDIVVDPVGGPRFLDSVRTLAPDGRLLSLGFADGEIPLTSSETKVRDEALLALVLDRLQPSTWKLKLIRKSK